MAGVIKKFFEKKKIDNKFKQAGEGHSLAESSSKKQCLPQNNVPQIRQQPTSSAKSAGEAALARLQQTSATKSKKPSSKTASWKSQIKEEMDFEMSRAAQMNTQIPQQQKRREIVSDNVKTVQEGVLHSCPVCPVVLPYKQVEEHLHECLRKELDGEPLMITVTMIHSLNKDKTLVDGCIRILGQYLQNIIDHKDEEKYRKIRKGNKTFQKKVSCVIGAEEFLLKGCGFEEKMLPFEANGITTDECFYVMSETIASDSEKLSVVKQMLIEAEPLKIELDRNMKLYVPSATSNAVDSNPSSFYNVTASELKKEQINRSNNIEKMSQLRTKAMREADSTTRKYLYTVIRIRFPDGILLQGTFSASEYLRDVIAFIKEHLQHDWMPFTLLDAMGKPLTDEKLTLSDLRLLPSAILNIACDIVSDIAAASQDGKVQFIKDEYLPHIQQL